MAVAKKAAKKIGAKRAVVERKRPPIPWETLRREYVEGIPTETVVDGKTVTENHWPTYDQLAKRHNLPRPGTLRERGAEERWQEGRVVYQAQMTQERNRERSKELAREATDFDSRTLNYAKLGVNAVGRRLAQMMQEDTARQAARQAAVEALGRGEPVDRSVFYSPLGTGDLERLANALDRFNTIGRRALGYDETQRIEVTGVDGGPIEVDVTAELVRPNADRIARMLVAVDEAGLLDKFLDMPIDDGEDDKDVEDAEVVEEDEQLAIEASEHEGTESESD